MSIRPVKKIVAAKPTLEGAGVHLRRAVRFGQTSDYDPFLLLDDFRNDVPDDYLAGFPWHPHLAGTVEHGMAIGVAPLTTTVMSAVEPEHAGVASGVNNAVSRVAGLVAIAEFGIVLVRVFDARIGPALDEIELTASGRSAVDRELPKLAGADLGSGDVVSTVDPDQRVAIRRVVDESFVSAFRRVMLTAAAVALGAAVAGVLT